MGTRLTRALGGEAAMQALAETQYDVVLLDLIMPGISGHDILDYAAREKLDCKIIVVSGDSSFSGVKHALQAGAFDFVKKPYEAAELIATMGNGVTSGAAGNIRPPRWKANSKSQKSCIALL